MSRIVTICALVSEASCIKNGKLLTQEITPVSCGMSLVISGIGKDNAEKMTRLLLAEEPDCIICFGTAGALVPGVAPGDVIIPDNVIDTHGNNYIVDNTFRTRLHDNVRASGTPVHTGTLLTTDVVLDNSTAKQQAGVEYGACAVDMESAAVLTTVAGNDRVVDVVIARVIIDPVTLALPQTILRNSDSYGRIRPVTLMLDLLKNATEIPAFLRLVKCYYRSSSSLKTLAGRIRELDARHNAA